MGSGNKSQRLKKGPWSLRETERQGKRPGVGGGEMPWLEGMGGRLPCSRDGTSLGPPLEGVYLEVSREDSDRIFISFPGVSLQGYSLY